MIIAKRGSLKYGEAVMTDSGYLPCKKVVHAVGPVFRDVGLSQSKYLLRRACLNSLNVAQEYISIALPAFASGRYGMPKDECAKVMFDAVEEFVECYTNIDDSGETATLSNNEAEDKLFMNAVKFQNRGSLFL